MTGKHLQIPPLFLFLSKPAVCRVFRFLFYFLLVWSLAVEGADKNIKNNKKINQAVAPPVLSFSTSNFNGFQISCFGLSDGFIDLTVSGGTPPYTYQWSTSAISEDLSNIPAGTYVVTVKDFNNEQTVDSVTLTEPALLVITTNNFDDVLCAGDSNGVVDITVSGGVPSYTYQWSNGEVTEDVTNLPAGTHTITITDLNLCTVTASYDINEPEALANVFGNTPFTCGQANGSITTNVTGGTGSIGYSWSNGFTTSSINNLSAGTYTVTITDQNFCVLTDSFQLTGTTPPVISLDSAVNVKCNGTATGGIYITPSGSNPFTYQWSNSTSGQDLTNVGPGTYTVTVTDVNLCTSTSTQTITQPSAINISGSITNVSCFGGSNGGVNVTATGGTGSFGYVWNNGTLTEDISGVIANTYTITATDANLCTSVNSFTVTQPPDISLSLTPTNASCNISNGSITANASGGTGTLTYLWNTSATTATISSLSAGTYTVTVTDGNLCTKISSVAITNTGFPAISLVSLTNVSCNGSNNGAVNISVSGGAGSYTYLWSNSATSQDITNVVANTYTVTVTDGAFCTSSNSYTVSQPPVISLSLTPANPTCNNANGSVAANASGGTGTLSYLWNTSSTTSTISSLTAGTYTVTVTDANFCTQTSSTTLTNSGVPSISLFGIANVSCFGGSDGSVNISVSGGAGGYTYLWSNSATSQDITNVTANTYAVTVTDAALCTTSNSYTVTQPSDISLSLSPTDPTCSIANGSITANASGGTGTISYLWNTSATTATISSLASGTYTVTVTDGNLCTKISSVTLTNAGVPAISLVGITNVTCFGGNNGGINISVSGGTSGYTYLWSNSATSQDISNVIANTYTVTVTDGAFCTATNSYTITQPSDISLLLTPVNPTCNQSNGSITANGSGGTGALTYLWNTSSTSSSITNLASGTYTVTATDGNLCSKIASVTLTNSGIPAITLNAITNVSCFGGNNGGVNISVSGGTAGYNYLWSNSATTEDITGVAANNYTVTVTDAALCTASSTYAVTQPGDISLSLNPSNATCNISNGSVTASASGGTGSLSYLWNTSATTATISSLAAGTYTVTVSDVNLCSKLSTVTIINTGIPSITPASVTNVSCFGGNNGAININITGGVPSYSFLWNTSATSQNLINLSANTYTVTVTDSTFCTATSSFTITTPPDISITLNQSNPSCNNNNGSVSANASGGTGTLSYLWSTSATTSSISGLSPGTYTVTVTDSNLCSKVDSATLINSALPVITFDSLINPGCPGQSNGAIYVTVSSGTPPYVYLWSNAVVVEDNLSIPAGNYTLTVTDLALCIVTFDTTIIDPPLLQDSIIAVNSTCGNSNGSATAVPFGGTPGYSFQWSTSVNDTLATISNLAAGTYTVTITDTNNCTITDSVIITTTPQVAILLDSIINPLCSNGTGSIYTHATGGTPGFSYLWNNGITTGINIGIIPGVYTLTVTDTVGCMEIDSFTVQNAPPPLLDSIVVTNATCGNSTGSAIVYPYGGTPGYSYQWSSGANDTLQTVSNLSPGLYLVTITDSNGCTIIDSATIISSPAISIITDSIIHPKCAGQTTGSIYTSVTGGTPGIQYLWNNGVTQSDNIGIVPGIYTLTVTDTLGCTDTAGFTILPAPSAVDDSVQIVNSTCGNSNGSITIFPFGGTPGYDIQWSTSVNDTLNTISNIGPGTYVVTITDTNSCIKIDTIVITTTPVVVITLDSIIHPLCANGTGSIYTTVTGGTPGYSFVWSNGVLVSDNVGISAGTYTLTLTDTLGCTDIDSFVVNPPPPVIGDSILFTNAICGSNTGSATVYPYGGSGGFSYQWSSSVNDTLASVSNLIPGTYTVTITDANGCTKADSVTITTTGNNLLITDSIVNPKCYSDSGAIYLFVTGGTGTYSFAWSNGPVTQNNLNVPSGSYSVIVTSGTCTASHTSVIGPAPSQLLDSIAVTNAACGINNGIATVYPYGGVLPYSILWSTSDTTQTTDSLSQGTYYVTITDINGCQKIDSAIILNTGAPVTSIDTIIQPKCFGGVGSIIINVSGGTTPYTFLWSNGPTTQNDSNIVAGVYTVTVTGGNNCSASATYSLNQPMQIQDSALVNPAHCGDNDGSATVYPYNGVGSYSYVWSTGSTIQAIFGQFPGTYTVSITDANLCFIIDTVVIPNDPGPVLTLNTLNNILCNGQNTGAINLNTTGGTPNYQYQWNTNAITEDISGLPAGTYSVTVTDANNCTSTFDTVITEPPAIIPVFTTTPAGCGQSNGTATVNGTGGVPPYNYIWFNSQTSQTITGLSAGSWTVTVTDTNNCSVAGYALVSNSGGPSVTFSSIVNNTCYGDSLGSISVNITGGSVPYSILWSNGLTGNTISNLSAGTYTITVTDADSCITILDTLVTENPQIIAVITTTPANCGSATGTAYVFPTGGVGGYSYLWPTLGNDTLQFQTNLPVNVYPVIITDGLGCTLDTSAVITSPGAPQIQLDTIIAPSCYGVCDGEIQITVSGGSMPYSFFWSNGATSEDLDSLCVGAYTVIVTDSSGCVAAFGFTVSQPQDITIQFNITPATCGGSNGSAVSIVGGGSPGYSYQWSVSNTTCCLFNVPAASYTLTVTDSHGCTKSAIANISNLNGPSIAVTDSGNVTCAGLSNGFITTSVTGGTGALTYNWIPGNFNTPSISGLPGNTYTLTVTDANNCLAIRTVTILEPNPISYSAFIPINNPPTYNISCYSLNDGTIQLFVNGGTPYTAGGFPSYNYQWSTSASDTLAVVGGLIAGTYTVTITDSLGCIKSGSFILTEPPPVIATAGSSFRICGVDTATLIATTPSYGTGSWQLVFGTSGIVSPTLPISGVVNLNIGDNIFLWKVTDGTCNDSDVFIITRDTTVESFAGSDRDVCIDSITLAATQPQFGNGIWSVGTGSAVFVDDPMDAISQAFNLALGSNILIWTITNGTCFDEDTVIITLLSPIECQENIQMPTGFTPNDDGYNDLFVIKGIDDIENKLTIYNRWGNVVYEKENYQNNWNGDNMDHNPLPDGTYFAILKVPSRSLVLKSYIDLRR